MRLWLVLSDGLAAVDATPFEAGDQGFHFHEACNPWLRVRAQGYARRSRVNGQVDLGRRSVKRRVRLTSRMNAAGKLTALRQSSGVEICTIALGQVRYPVMREAGSKGLWVAW